MATEATAKNGKAEYMRKLQLSGYSTVIVSLPKEWVNAKSLKPGDYVRFVEEGGSLRLDTETEPRKKKEVVSVIEADLCLEKGLLSKLVTGSYIMGRDAIQIVSKSSIRQSQMEEIRRTIDILSGTSVISQRKDFVNLQIFVDSSKYPLYKLVRRLESTSLLALKSCLRALEQQNVEVLKEVRAATLEAEKLYWLMIREIFVRVQDGDVASSTDVESLIELIEMRGFTSVLHDISNLSDSLGESLRQLLTDQPRRDLRNLAKCVKTFVGHAEDMVNAFLIKDVKLANATELKVKESEGTLQKMAESTLLSMKNPSSELNVRTCISILAEIAEHCATMAEFVNNVVATGSTRLSRTAAKET